ncbi:MAG: SMP-30/gluconolactonase/LRE family protein, partial [Rhodospirillaceae bacterium]|nr:SMP-30/gluconolactonase/LRE family protein [Rhodospirillaceae bacterium]
MSGNGNSPRCVLAAACELAEGPVWDERTQRLCFVDIEAPALFRFDPESEALERWAMPAKIGCFAL